MLNLADLIYSVEIIEGKKSMPEVFASYLCVTKITERFR
jgi:hypothetical protein